MTRFERRQYKRAQEFAAEGGQALHVFRRIPGMPAPGCFKRSKFWAHLYDQDLKRLKATARRLGVRVIKVHHEGTKRQHIDLCGKPLDRALGESCEPQAWIDEARQL